MGKDIECGYIEDIQRYTKDICFAVITPMDSPAEFKRIPVYVELGEEYKGKVVDIITERSGFCGKHFKQTVKMADPPLSSSTEMPYWLVKRINSEYRNLEMRLSVL